jgi:hypothetical protein
MSPFPILPVYHLFCVGALLGEVALALNREPAAQYNVYCLGKLINVCPSGGLLPFFGLLALVAALRLASATTAASLVARERKGWGCGSNVRDRIGDHARPGICLATGTVVKATIEAIAVTPGRFA